MVPFLVVEEPAELDAGSVRGRRLDSSKLCSAGIPTTGAGCRTSYELAWSRASRVFLSLFDRQPEPEACLLPAQRMLRPGAEHRWPVRAAASGFRFELIESGKVVALNFPMAANPGVARAVGTFMKQDFQRAMLNRIPEMEQHPSGTSGEALFLCDEYQAFATVGESDPTGDEKFFALSRQAKCIAIVATQSISSLKSTLPGESWRTLLQTFRTKIFLSLSDDFSAKTASDLCGREEQMSPHYSISRVRAGCAGVDADRPGPGPQGRDDGEQDRSRWPGGRFSSRKQFMELKNAQCDRAGL